MTEQTPEKLPDSTPAPTARPMVRSGAWIGGAVLITLGLVFLLQNLTGFELQNWWAIFILFPAVSSLERAYRIYQVEGRLSSRARNPLLWGIALVAVAIIFLVGGFGSWWPIFLVGAGLLLLVNGLLPD